MLASAAATAWSSVSGSWAPATPARTARRIVTSVASRDTIEAIRVVARRRLTGLRAGGAGRGPGLAGCLSALWIQVFRKASHAPGPFDGCDQIAARESLEKERRADADAESYADLVRAVQAGQPGRDGDAADARAGGGVPLQPARLRPPRRCRRRDAGGAAEDLPVRGADPRAGGVPRLAVPHRPQRLPDRPPQAGARAGSPRVARRDRRATATGTSGTSTRSIRRATPRTRRSTSASAAACGGRSRAVPRPYRVVVVLREIEGLSTREVAEVLGISEANVKTRLHRARVLLREQLEAS